MLIKLNIVLNPTDSARDIALIQEGQSQYYVAQIIGISKCSVQRTVERFHETGCYTRRVGSRKRRFTPQDKRFLTLYVLRNWLTSAVSAQNEL